MGSGETTNGFIVRNRSVLVMGLGALTIAALADLIAGLFLSTMEDYLLLIPGMMVLIYCAIGTRGNIFGAMGSRLGTSMHMGTFKMSLKKGSVLRSNLESSIALTLILSLAMGLLSWLVVTAIFGKTIAPQDFVFISMLGGLLAGIIVVLFNILIAREGYKRNWDVDNITAPLIAAAGDIVTIPMLFIAVRVYLQVDPWITNVATAIMIVVTVLITVTILRRKTPRRKRMNEAKRILKASTPVLIACLILEIAAGLLIESQTEKLVQYSILLILLPAFLNEGNALSGMLTSRLSSMLHLGTLGVNSIPPKNAYENFGIIYILALITFALIGTAAFLVSPASLTYAVTMGIIIVAGLLTTTVLNFISYYVAVLATRFNLNPDDHCIPITSSAMDVIGTAILVLVIAAFI